MNKGNKVKKSTKQVQVQVQVPQDRQIAMDYYNKALDTWLINHSHVTAHRILCNGMNKRTGFAPRSARGERNSANRATSVNYSQQCTTKSTKSTKANKNKRNACNVHTVPNMPAELIASTTKTTSAMPVRIQLSDGSFQTIDVANNEFVDNVLVRLPNNQSIPLYDFVKQYEQYEQKQEQQREQKREHKNRFNQFNVQQAMNIALKKLNKELGYPANG